MQNTIWLSVSLFCPKKVWNLVLSEGTLPFLDTISRGGKRSQYLLEFNNCAGENIRFSVLVANAKAEDLAKQTDDYFKDFFSKHFIPKEEELLPVEVKDLFMPFPNNTVQYGLYAAVENNEGEDSWTLRAALSAIVTEALTEEEYIDEETIWTLAFYLNMAVIKAFGRPRSVEFMNFYNVNDTIDDSILAKFSDNQETLREIANSIVYSETVDDVPSWLKNWTKICKGEIRKDPIVASKSLKMHIKLVDIIYKQLGMNQQMRIMLFYFISQVLNN